MLKSDIVDIPDDYLCPITQELMQNPVVAADGHSYEEKAIVQWLQTGHNSSPLTGEKLNHRSLIQNHRLKAIIEVFREKLPEIQRERQIRIDLDKAIKLREEMIAHYADKKEKENVGLAKAFAKEREEKEMLKQDLAKMQKQMQQMQAQLEAQMLLNKAKRPSKEELEEGKLEEKEFRGTCLRTLQGHTDTVYCLQVLPTGELATGSAR